MILTTLPNQVRKMGHESTTELSWLLVGSGTGISGSYVFTVVVGVLEIKHISFVELFSFSSC